MFTDADTAIDCTCLNFIDGQFLANSIPKLYHRLAWISDGFSQSIKGQLIVFGNILYG